MKKVLVASGSFGFGADRPELLELFNENDMEPVFQHLSQCKDNLEGFDAIIIGTELVKAEHFEKGKNLKAVIKFGVGTDNIDKKAAEKNNVKVLNLPGVNSHAVAEMAFSLIMAVTRRIAESDRKLRGGEWSKFMGWSTQGKTLGIIGTGAIGIILANMVSGLNMKIIGYDPFPNDEFMRIGGKYVELEELFRTSDYISLHVPLIDSTHHLVGRKEFELMKSTAILINTARGPIIDEEALYDALAGGKIAAAGIDVFENEPPGDSQLFQLDNITCAPHIAAYTYETMRHMDRMCIQKLAESL